MDIAGLNADLKGAFKTLCETVYIVCTLTIKNCLDFSVFLLINFILQAEILVCLCILDTASTIELGEWLLNCNVTGQNPTGARNA